jgi:polar amino acid transport system substrate-binding protein
MNIIRGLRYLALGVAALLLGVVLGGRAHAQTVDEILKRGTINIGVLIDLPPFGLLDEQQQPTGYDVEVAQLLGKYLGVKVNLVQVTASNRLPFLVTGKVDLIVATFGITPERAKQVLFSIPYSAIENTVYGLKDKTIKTTADLKGMRVGVPRGTVQDVLLTNALGANARMMRFDDTPGTYQAMLTGQTDAMAETAITFDAVLKAHPEAPVEKKFVLLRQPNGITMRADQFNLLRWVDTFVYFTKNNGELGALWQKWFHEPMPELPVF